MARDEFDAAGEYVQISELEGKLLLVTPYEHVEGITTIHGEKDAIRADIAVLNEDGTYDEYEDVMVFQGALIAALRRRIKVEKSMGRDPVTGIVSHFETTTVRRVLGVLGKGEAKRGQSAPFQFQATTDEQKDLARAYQAKNPTPEPVKTLVRQELPVVHDSFETPAVRTQAHPAMVAGHDEFGPGGSTPARTTQPTSAPAADDPWAAE